MNVMHLSLRTVVLAAGLWACGAVAEPAAPANKEQGTLVGSNGMTLYVFDKDSGGKSACNGPCASNWPPLMANAGDKASGDWSIIMRDDGQRQWAYKGRPLYFWAKDQKPGDKTGDGFNGVWHIAK
jgi:predicted lipoprotein with Yx(FWY)xxD motif